MGDIPPLDASLIAKAEGDPRYISRPKLPDEHVPRVMGQTYERVKGVRDVRRAGRIRMSLAGITDPQGLAESARAHLVDAANSKLPDEVRAEHYVIAGARIYVLIERGPEEPIPGVSLAFEEWMQGLVA
jgi:hypothetical protein